MKKSCSLCLCSGKNLVDSHIIPRAFYEDLRAKKLKRIEKSGHATVYQKGIYGKFLCLNCEQKFGEIDSKAISTIKKQKSWKKFHSENTHNAFVVENALAIKKDLHEFGLSVLWRAAASERPEFANIALGDYKEELRNYFSSKPARSDLTDKTSLYFSDYRGGRLESDQSFRGYRLHKKSALFKQSYGNFHCHVFGFPYGELYMRLGGDSPRQGYFELTSDNFSGKAVPWTSNLSREYPNWFFYQAPSETSKSRIELITPAK